MNQEMDLELNTRDKIIAERNCRLFIAAFITLIGCICILIICVLALSANVSCKIKALMD